MRRARSAKAALGTTALLVGSTLALVLWGEAEPDGWYQLIQEDGVVEWITVWALLPTAFLCLGSARSGSSPGPRARWFWLGLAAFCLFFAGEEISWGQRLFGYQPPPYFLEHNSQQEANVHNLFKEHLRTKYLLMGIFAVWGGLLPFATLAAAPRRLVERLGLVLPPWSVVPAMLSGLGLLYWYPHKYTGELAECLFAVCLLTIALAHSARADPGASGSRDLGTLVGVLAAVCLAGVGTVELISSLSGRGDESHLLAAQAEADALVADWQEQEARDEDEPSSCKAHLRVYTWVDRYELDALEAGTFATLVQGDRAEFFLDPWNNPYWLRHRCRKGPDTLTLYSFGPNRKRDSSSEALGGDDIGTTLTLP